MSRTRWWIVDFVALNEDSSSIRAAGQFAEDFGNSIARGSVGMVKDADRRGRGQPTSGLSELDRALEEAASPTPILSFDRALTQKRI